MRGRLERLPVLALPVAPVSGHDDDPPSAAELLRERDPAPFEMPIPSEPERSIPGTPTSGCPSSPPKRLQPKQPLARTTPSASAAYSPGTSCPFDEKNTSRSGSSGCALRDVQLPRTGGVRRRRARRRSSRDAPSRHASRRRGRSAGTRPRAGQPGVGIDVSEAEPVELGLGTRRRSACPTRDGSRRARGLGSPRRPRRPAVASSTDRRDDRGPSTRRPRRRRRTSRAETRERRGEHRGNGNASRSTCHRAATPPGEQPHEGPWIEAARGRSHARRSQGADHARGDPQEEVVTSRSRTSHETPSAGSWKTNECSVGEVQPPRIPPSGVGDVRRLSPRNGIRLGCRVVAPPSAATSATAAEGAAPCSSTGAYRGQRSSLQRSLATPRAYSPGCSDRLSRHATEAADSRRPSLMSGRREHCEVVVHA